MKSAVIALVLTSLPLASYAETDIPGPLASVEARVGYGASLGGQAENMAARISPLSLAVRGSWLFREQPRLSAYAGLSAELGDRNSAGFGAGVSLPLSRFARASAGSVAILAPFRLIGPRVALGSCVPTGSARPCLDLEATFFVFGNDLPAGSVVTQLQAVLAVSFDVL